MNERARQANPVFKDRTTISIRAFGMVFTGNIIGYIPDSEGGNAKWHRWIFENDGTSPSMNPLAHFFPGRDFKKFLFKHPDTDFGMSRYLVLGNTTLNQGYRVTLADGTVVSGYDYENSAPESRERRMIPVRLKPVLYELNGVSLDEAQNIFSSLSEEFSDYINLKFEVDDEYGTTVLNLWGERLETDEEYRQRRSAADK